MISKQVEIIAKFLEGEGLKLWPKTMIIRGISFDFDGVMFAAEGFSDIVLLIDAVSHDLDSRIRRIHGLAKALDFLGKTNPLTTVVIGRTPNAVQYEQIMQVSRVLTVSDFNPQAGSEQLQRLLKNSLSILTPLDVGEDLNATPSGDQLVGDLFDEIEEEIAALETEAKFGSERVEATMMALLKSTLIDVDEI